MAAKSYVIIDTGFFIALSNKKDRFHHKARKTLETIQDRKWITTWPVLTETAHLLSDVSISEYFKLLEALNCGLCEIFDLGFDHLERINTLSQKYKNLPMDLADASLVILAEEMSISDIVSTDQRDFQAYRWKNKHPFNNLMTDFN